jgi:hypothetical protein
MTFQGVPAENANVPLWLRDMARAINAQLLGKLNCNVDVTLLPNAAATVVVDSRIWPGSALYFMPLTASADAQGSPSVLAAAIGAGTVTLTHTNTADVDKTYRMTILG